MIRKSILLILTASLFFLTSCDEKVFNFVLNLDDTYEYTVSGSGPFSEFETITRQQVMEDIEIESDAEIEEVNIESIAVRIAELEGNDATAVVVDGLLYDGDGTLFPIVVFEDLEIQSTADQFVSLTDMNPAGVEALAEKFKGYINETDIENFVVEVKGEPVPSGSRVEARIELKVRATVKFKENLEVPFFVGGE